MDIAHQLKTSDLFKEVDLSDLDLLVGRMHRQIFKEGTVLFDAGDPGDTMYIILSGTIRIFGYDTKGQEITLIHYGVGEVFGEFSPIDQRPRSASAQATTLLEVLAFSRDDFLKSLVERPQIGLAMMQSLVKRLRSTTIYLENAQPDRSGTLPVSDGDAFSKNGMETPAIDPFLDEVSPFLGVQRQESPSPKPKSGGLFDRITHTLDNEEVPFIPASDPKE